MKFVIAIIGILFGIRAFKKLCGKFAGIKKTFSRTALVLLLCILFAAAAALLVWKLILFAALVLFAVALCRRLFRAKTT